MRKAPDPHAAKHEVEGHQSHQHALGQLALLYPL